jgi:hypothetical protein
MMKVYRSHRITFSFKVFRRDIASRNEGDDSYDYGDERGRFEDEGR